MRFFVTALFGLVIALLGYHGHARLGGVTASASKAPVSDHVPLVEQNFVKINRKGLSKMISDCFNLYYQYLSVANYFGRADVALPGFKKFFTTSAERELTRAKDMMEYMNKRGGTLDLLAIKKPVTGDFSDGRSALDLARRLSRKLNARALVNHNIAVSKRDPNLKLFYEETIIDGQVDVIKELGDLITRLDLMNKSRRGGLALYMFDLELQK